MEGYGYEKYPRRELIKTTIQNGIQYHPKTPILLPHYDQSLKSLVQLWETRKDEIGAIPSKKKLQDYEILGKTLEHLNLTGPLYESLQNRIDERKNATKKK